MISKILIYGFASISAILLVEGTPLLDSSLATRGATPCDVGGTPQLYKDYFGDSCPPVNVMNKDGSCPMDATNPFLRCGSYCEVKQTFFYDQEKPVVNNPYCHGPLTCTVSQSEAFTYTWTANINVGFSKYITAAITGGYNSADAITNLQSTAVTLKFGECGYFTFLPLLHYSW